MPGEWKAGYYTVRQECLLEYDRELVSQFSTGCILQIYSKSSGSGGGRATSHFIDYTARSRHTDQLQERKSNRLHVDKLVGSHLIHWFKRAKSGEKGAG